MTEHETFNQQVSGRPYIVLILFMAIYIFSLSLVAIGTASLYQSKIDKLMQKQLVTELDNKHNKGE